MELNRAAEAFIRAFQQHPRHAGLAGPRRPLENYVAVESKDLENLVLFHNRKQPALPALANFVRVLLRRPKQLRAALFDVKVEEGRGGFRSEALLVGLGHVETVNDLAVLFQDRFVLRELPSHLGRDVKIDAGGILLGPGRKAA